MEVSQKNEGSETASSNIIAGQSASHISSSQTKPQNPDVNTSPVDKLQIPQPKPGYQSPASVDQGIQTQIGEAGSAEKSSPGSSDNRVQQELDRLKGELKKVKVRYDSANQDVDMWAKEKASQGPVDRFIGWTLGDKSKDKLIEQNQFLVKTYKEKQEALNLAYSQIEAKFKAGDVDGANKLIDQSIKLSASLSSEQQEQQSQRQKAVTDAFAQTAESGQNAIAILEGTRNMSAAIVTSVATGGLAAGGAGLTGALLGGTLTGAGLRTAQDIGKAGTEIAGGRDASKAFGDVVSNLDNNISAAAVDAIGTVAGLRGAQAAVKMGQVGAGAIGASTGAMTSETVAYADGVARGTDERSLLQAGRDVAVAGTVSLLTGAPGGLGRATSAAARVGQEAAEVVGDVVGGAGQEYLTTGQVTATGAVQNAIGSTTGRIGAAAGSGRNSAATDSADSAIHRELDTIDQGPSPKADGQKPTNQEPMTDIPQVTSPDQVKEINGREGKAANDSRFEGNPEQETREQTSRNVEQVSDGVESPAANDADFSHSGENVETKNETTAESSPDVLDSNLPETGDRQDEPKSQNTQGTVVEPELDAANDQYWGAPEGMRRAVGDDVVPTEAIATPNGEGGMVVEFPGNLTRAELGHNRTQSNTFVKGAAQAKENSKPVAEAPVAVAEPVVKPTREVPNFSSEQVRKQFQDMPKQAQEQLLDAIGYRKTKVEEKVSGFRKSGKIAAANDYAKRHGEAEIQHIEVSGNKIYVGTPAGSLVLGQSKGNWLVQNHGVLPQADNHKKVTRLLSRQDIESLEADGKIVPKDLYSPQSPQNHVSVGSKPGFKSRFISVTNTDTTVNKGEVTTKGAYWDLHKLVKGVLPRDMDPGTSRYIASGLKGLAKKVKGDKPSPEQLVKMIQENNIFQTDKDGNLVIGVIDTESLFSGGDKRHPGAILDTQDLQGKMSQNFAAAVGEGLLDTPYVPASAITITKVPLEQLAQKIAGTTKVEIRPNQYEDYVNFGQSRWNELGKMK